MTTNNSKNLDKLMDFYLYCLKHPEERFWQALRNWSGYKYILVTDEESLLDIDIMQLEDTFYKE